MNATTGLRRERPSPAAADDGRNVRPDLGGLHGEAAEMVVRRHPEADYPAPRDVLRRVPSRPDPDEPPSYYGLPPIKEPTWIGTVPVYFWAGGVTGAAGVLSAAAQAFGGRSMAGLTRAVNWLGATMNALGGAMLITDLGVKRRFVNMLRVVRPSSPMSLGSWTLTLSSAFHGIAALFGGRRGPGGTLARGAGYAAATMDVPLAGYTAVLLTQSAVPAWKGARRTLPVLFVSSAAASAGSVLDLLPLDEDACRAVKVFGSVAKVAELAAMQAVEREAGETPCVAAPFRHGASGALWNAAKGLTAASLLFALLPGDRRWKRVTSALLGNAGALTMRYAVLEVGRASARDPHATFEQHRSVEDARRAT